jgi:hypothetical protein
MSLRKRLTTMAAAAAVVAVVAPVASAGAAVRLPPPFIQSQDPANICLSGVVDPGPFGPMGPYGPSGPYGPNGPLHGQANPIGNAATCGGLLTYILRGGTLSSFVQANIASAGVPAGG